MFIDFLAYLGHQPLTWYIAAVFVAICAAVKLEELKERQASRERYAKPFEWVTDDEEETDPHVSNLKIVNGRS